MTKTIVTVNYDKGYVIYSDDEWGDVHREDGPSYIEILSGYVEYNLDGAWCSESSFYIKVAK